METEEIDIDIASPTLKPDIPEAEGRHSEDLFAVHDFDINIDLAVPAAGKKLINCKSSNVNEDLIFPNLPNGFKRVILTNVS